MIGRVLCNRYRLLSPLGRGAMGAVWLAEHLELGTPVAIKLMSDEMAPNAEAALRFRREARAAASLKSRHVVNIIDYGIDGDTSYIAMELLSGETLATRLERRRVLTATETSQIVTQVSYAIDQAHERGIVHRDLKPPNIFLVWQDGEEIAKVLDFGIAKIHNFGRVTGAITVIGTLLGSPCYMSPEQAEGLDSVDYRTDIWSIGVIAFECIVGERPFDAAETVELLHRICYEPAPVPSQLANVPPGFDEWFMRCVAKDVRGRFGSAREQALQLAAICGFAAPGFPRAEPRVSMQSTPAMPPASDARPGFESSTVQPEPISGESTAPLHSFESTSPVSREFSLDRLMRPRLLSVAASIAFAGAGVAALLWLLARGFARNPATQDVSTASGAPSNMPTRGPIRNQAERIPLDVASSSPIAVAPLDSSAESQTRFQSAIPTSAITGAPRTSSIHRPEAARAGPSAARTQLPSASPTAKPQPPHSTNSTDIVPTDELANPWQKPAPR